MRTTLAIDDDVLLAAKAIASHQQRSAGAVIFDPARRALDWPRAGTSRNGISLLNTSSDAAPVTLEIVHDDLPRPSF